MVGCRNCNLFALTLHQILSGIPMVGCRNQTRFRVFQKFDFIRHSDGGVSELSNRAATPTGYFIRHSDGGVSELCVGYLPCYSHFIRHSDGGVSEPNPLSSVSKVRFYQAFRWWGVGTFVQLARVV